MCRSVRSTCTSRSPADHTYREISCEEHRGVGYLHFDFYDGAMSTEQCSRLREAYLYAGRRRGRRRCGVRSRRRRGRGARGRRCEPLLRSHGRPLRVGVLDVSVAASRRIRHDRPADRPAIQADRHPARRRDRTAGRCVRTERRRVSARKHVPVRSGSLVVRPRVACREADPPDARRAEEAARGLPRRGDDPLTPMLSSGPTAAITRPDTASPTSSGNPVAATKSRASLRAA